MAQEGREAPSLLHGSTRAAHGRCLYAAGDSTVGGKQSSRNHRAEVHPVGQWCQSGRDVPRQDEQYCGQSAVVPAALLQRRAFLLCGAEDIPRTAKSATISATEEASSGRKQDKAHRVRRGMLYRGIAHIQIIWANVHRAHGGWSWHVCDWSPCHKRKKGSHGIQR